MLTREQILATAPALLAVEVPEWGGTVYARKLGPVQAATVQDETNTGRKVVLCVLFGVANADGARLFADEDAAWLESQPEALMVRMATHVLRHSGVIPPEGEGEAPAGN